jgi:hypothetical protein
MYIPEGYGTLFPYMVVHQGNIWWISHRLVNEPYD